MMKLPPNFLRILCAGFLAASGGIFAGWNSVSANPILAMQNPFGDPEISDAPVSDDPADRALPERPEVSPSLDVGKRLIIRAIADSDPQTEIELAKALRIMVDLSQYDQARYYLSVLQAKSLDDAGRFKIFEALGTDFFLELHGTDELQPVGSRFAKQILKAARTQATHPDRIQALIQRLSDEDISARSSALRKLRRLGPAAVAEMIHVFTDRKRQSEFSAIRSALTSMGDDALPPLLGAGRASHLQVQAEAIRALGHYRSGEATDVMMRTYLVPSLPESLRRVALDSLMNSDRLPADPGYVEDRFYQRSRDFLMGRRKIVGGFSETVTRWEWDAKTERLVAHSVSTATATRIAAAERAADLYAIGPESSRNRAIFLLTQLEAAKRIAGPRKSIVAAGVEKMMESIMGQFPRATAGEIEAVLAEALKLELIPAATACCELLGEIGSSDLVVGSHRQRRPLVQALQLGDRHLQFAAFEAIAKIDPQQAFAGSSYQLLLAVYMAGSTGQGSGLVGHIRANRAQSYAAMLQSSGLYGQSATSSRDFFQTATHDPDLEILLVTDTLDRPDYAELIQQLRKDLRTKRLPIGLLVRDEKHGIRVQLMQEKDPYFMTMPMSLDPKQVASYVDRLRQLADPWPVTALDRQHHAQQAMKWLNQVAGDRDHYRFYDLGRHHEELSQLVYLPGFAESGSQILVRLGTPTAQRELLNFASQSDLPITERKKAAEAFSESIKIGGTLLTHDEILKQYDRYNASVSEPVETQQLLGSILDALESLN